MRHAVERCRRSSGSTAGWPSGGGAEAQDQRRRLDPAGGGRRLRALHRRADRRRPVRGQESRSGHGQIITAANPDAEVLSTDLGSQTLRIRDRRTGKEVTLSFDDVKKGRLKFSATGDNGEVANLEIGGGEGKLPSWVPAYPGARAQGNLTASGADGGGVGEGGIVTFTTPDPPSKVTEFYDAKCKEMGMSVNLSQLSDSGGLIVGADDGKQRTLHVMVAGGSGDTTITVTYGRKR